MKYPKIAAKWKELEDKYAEEDRIARGEPPKKEEKPKTNWLRVNKRRVKKVQTDKDPRELGDEETKYNIFENLKEHKGDELYEEMVIHHIKEKENKNYEPKR